MTGIVSALNAILGPSRSRAISVIAAASPYGDYNDYTIDALRLPEISAEFNNEERALLQLADAMTCSIEVPDALFAQVRSRFNDQQLVDLLGQGGLASSKVEAVERFAFYDRVRAASLIVQTGEASAYGNALFAKGVILN